MRRCRTDDETLPSGYMFEKTFEGLVINCRKGNEEIFGKLMADGELRKLAVELLLHNVYGE